MAEPSSTKTDHGKTLLSWTFPEVQAYQRSRGWYVGISVVGLLLLTFAIFNRNPLFAFIIVIAWALIFFRATQKPRLLTANVTEDGLQVGKDFFAYDDLAAFWIIFKPPAKTLYLRFKSALRPILGISFEDTNPNKLRAELRRFLQEDLSREDESASDAYGRLFKI